MNSHCSVTCSNCTHSETEFHKRWIWLEWSVATDCSEETLKWTWIYLLRLPARSLSNFEVSKCGSADAKIFQEVWRYGLRGKERLINKSAHLCLPLSFCSPHPNSWWHKKPEFVLMFVQSGGNLLDRDLANLNSLQKLSDPGGSRALDKQDWLFQRHAYISLFEMELLHTDGYGDISQTHIGGISQKKI